MLQGEHSSILLTFTLEHSAILLTFIKLPFIIKIFGLSIFEWPLKTSFTVHIFISCLAFVYLYLFVFYKYTRIQIVFVPEFSNMECHWVIARSPFKNAEVVFDN